MLTVCLVLAFLMWKTREVIGDERFNERKTLTDMNAIVLKLSDYRLKCGKYPQTLDELNFGVKSTCISFLAEPGKDIRLTDRWGNEFFYKLDSNSYRILSAGNSWLEASDKEKANLVTKTK